MVTSTRDFRGRIRLAQTRLVRNISQISKIYAFDRKLDILTGASEAADCSERPVGSLRFCVAHPLTIDERQASAVGLTRTAVRAQLATLQRDGTVEERGSQRGTSKPARVLRDQRKADSLSRLSMCHF